MDIFIEVIVEFLMDILHSKSHPYRFAFFKGVGIGLLLLGLATLTDLVNSDFILKFFLIDVCIFLGVGIVLGVLFIIIEYFFE